MSDPETNGLTLGQLHAWINDQLSIHGPGARCSLLVLDIEPDEDVQVSDIPNLPIMGEIDPLSEVVGIYRSFDSKEGAAIIAIERKPVTPANHLMLIFRPTNSFANQLETSSEPRLKLVVDNDAKLPSLDDTNS